MSMESKINIYICLSILIVLLMIVSIFIQVLLMKRILYFSRESHFISENKDSLLNNNTVNDAQPISRKAVDSDGINSSRNKQNIVSVDATGFISLAQAEPLVEGGQVREKQTELKTNSDFDKSYSKKTPINSIVPRTKSPSDSMLTKQKNLLNKRVDEIEESISKDAQIIVNSEIKPEEGGADLVVTSQNLKSDVVDKSSINPTEKEKLIPLTSENKEAVMLDQVALGKVDSNIENKSISLAEKISSNEIKEVKNHKEETLTVSSSLVLPEKNNIDNENYGDSVISLNEKKLNLGEIAESNERSIGSVNLAENITNNIDENKESYSSPVISEVVYETIDLNHGGESPHQEKVDQIAKQKEISTQIEDLTVKEVVPNSQELSFVDSEEIQAVQINSLNLASFDKNESGKVFDVDHFFKDDNSELVNKGIIEFSQDVSEEPKSKKVEVKSSSKKKEKIPTKSKIVPIISEKVILPDSNLDDKGIIFFDGVNSDLSQKNQNDPLSDILSFERNVLKNLSEKEQNSNNQVKKIKPREDSIITDKSKPLKLFDNVVKKLILNNQPQSGIDSTQRVVHEVQKEISLDVVRDTYQKIFSAYK